MDLSRVIKGQIVTEKAERQKSARTYTLLIDQQATKIDVKNALKKYYDADAVSVRVHIIRPKTRSFGAAKQMEKRHRSKRAIVTLAEKSKTLDLTTIKTA